MKIFHVHVSKKSFIVIKTHIHKSLFNERIKFCFEMKCESVSVIFLATNDDSLSVEGDT